MTQGHPFKFNDLDTKSLWDRWFSNWSLGNRPTVTTICSCGYCDWIRNGGKAK